MGSRCWGVGVKDELKNHLYDLELRLHHTEVRGDAVQLQALLADDFVEFASSGGVWNKAQVIEALLTEAPFIAPRVSDLTARELGVERVLLTYRRTTAKGPDTPASVTLRSSIWHAGVQGWQMEFHQGTRVPS